MTTLFFEDGTPSGPGEALAHYRTRAARATDGARWRLDLANLGLLSRAAAELPPGPLEVILPASDLAEDDTLVADEGEIVPTLRRLSRRSALSFSLSTGRPYVMPPPALDISTNDLCGLACVMCGNRNRRRDPRTHPPSEVRRLIDEAHAWGIQRVALTGAGEPFRDPHMLDHIAHASELGMLATVTSNGLPITAEVAARLATCALSISLSIHGASDPTHDAIAGVEGSAEGAWRAVRRLVEARRSTPGSRMVVNVSTVIQRANIDEIASLVERSHREGCDGHNLQPINLQHGSVGKDGGISRRDSVTHLASLWPTPAQREALDRMTEQLSSLRRRLGSFLHADEARIALMRRYFEAPHPGPLGVSCQVGERFLAVDHRGTIKPCYRLPWSLGDASPGRLRRLWNSLAYGRLRARIAGCPLVCLNNCFSR